jgi:hypothetical protein
MPAFTRGTRRKIIHNQAISLKKPTKIYFCVQTQTLGQNHRRNQRANGQKTARNDQDGGTPSVCQIAGQHGVASRITGTKTMSKHSKSVTMVFDQVTW